MSFFDTAFGVDLLREQRKGIGGCAHKKLRQLAETPVQLSFFVVCEKEGASAHLLSVGRSAPITALALRAKASSNAQSFARLAQRHPPSNRSLA